VDNVLGLARTGFIFTRSQEGKKLGQLIQTAQTGQGIQYRVLSCWVPGAKLVGGEVESQLRSMWDIGR